MVSKFANPVCNENFRSMKTGRLYRVHRHDGDKVVVEFYWLCDKCVVGYHPNFEKIQEEKKPQELFSNLLCA